MNKILKIGHRGAKGYVAENTLDSIKKAMTLGVDGVEIDVHLCKSGEVVVFHDFTLDRTTNGTGRIGDFSLSELKKLKIDKQYEIPTLLEVLDLIADSIIINIELKGDNTAQPTSDIINYYVANKGWSMAHVLVSSFKSSELMAVFNYNSNIPLGVLTEGAWSEALVFAKTIKAKAIHPDFKMLTKENVRKAKALGFQINTWTVNKKQDIEKIISYQVDAIISDFPDRI